MEDKMESDDVMEQKKKVNEIKSKFKAAAFLVGVSGISIISGFGYAVGVTRKSDPEMFDKGMIKARNLHNAGSTLALRALGWGSLYAVGGFTIFCCLVWKISGAQNMQDFRMKAGSILPKVPRNNPPQGRTEFDSLTDLLQYVIDEDVRIKKEKDQNNVLNEDKI